MKTFLASFVVLMAASAAHAQSVSLAPTDAKGILYQSNLAGFPFRLSSALGTGAVTTYDYSHWQPTIIHSRYSWAAEFDLSSVPAGMTVLSATLSVRATAPNTLSASVKGYVGNGAISTGDGSSAPILSTFVPSNDGTALDVTAFVRGLGAGSRYAGFRFDHADSRQGTVSYASVGTAGGPTLTIRYAPVPEPATMAPLGFGLAGLRRRRKAPTPHPSPLPQRGEGAC